MHFNFTIKLTIEREATFEKNFLGTTVAAMSKMG